MTHLHSARMRAYTALKALSAPFSCTIVMLVRAPACACPGLCGPADPWIEPPRLHVRSRGDSGVPSSLYDKACGRNSILNRTALGMMMPETSARQSYLSDWTGWTDRGSRPLGI